MWNRRDWREFFHLVSRRWERQRPPRPVYLSAQNRLAPAAGFSLTELEEAGLSVDQAQLYGLPVDAGRVNSYGPNVSALREFMRATRRPG
jgi:ribosomal protein L13E